MKIKNIFIGCMAVIALYFETLLPQTKAQGYAEYQKTYIPIIYKGELPADVILSAEEKMEQRKAQTQAIDKSDIDSEKRDQLYLRTVYEINDHLKNGTVYFNDELSQYLNKIVNRLLSKHPDLMKQIRVYPVKRLSLNALCYVEGTIFVHLGLIAGCESESQLAYILAHEIAHYVKRHSIAKVQKIQSLQNELSNRNKGLEASFKIHAFSRENELEADSYGYKLYCDAGYDPAQALASLATLENSSKDPNQDTLDTRKYFGLKNEFLAKEKEKEEDRKQSENKEKSDSNKTNTNKQTDKKNKIIMDGDTTTSKPLPPKEEKNKIIEPQTTQNKPNSESKAEQKNKNASKKLHRNNRNYVKEKPEDKYSQKELDSLTSTHPEAQARMEALAVLASNSLDNSVKPDLGNFQRLNATAKFELIEHEFRQANYIHAMYLIMNLIKEYPNNEYLKAKFATSLNWVVHYKQLEAVEFLDDKSFYEDSKTFNQLVDFILDASLDDIKKAALHFATEAKTDYPNNEEIVFAYALAQYNIPDEKNKVKEFLLDFAEQFPNGKRATVAKHLANRN